MRRAIVTGASSGIGQEFAYKLAREGYIVTAIARREERLQSLLESLANQGCGSEHNYLVADLAEASGRALVCQKFAEQRYQLLINNAGFSTFDPFYETPLDQQQKILAVNCQAVMELAHAFLRQSQAGDALINLGSIVSYLPTPTQPMYSASKSFIASFSECLWEEHRERKVYVMGLCPGITQTEFITQATGGDADGQTLPEAMIQSTAEVVEEALAALRRRKKAIIVTGRINRLMMLLPRMTTRHRLLKILAVLGDPDRAL